MLRGRRFPAWLVRRSYFRRIERWMKPRRRAAPPDAASPEPEATLSDVRSSDVLSSNVLPFPEQSAGTRGMAFTARRGVGTG